MSYYERRGFNKDLLPKSIPKQGRWIQRTKKKGEQRPFNIWFENKLELMNMNTAQFTLRLNNMFPNQPRTEENPVRYWTQDTIPRAKSQTKIAAVVAKTLNIDINLITKELIDVIENEIPIEKCKINKNKTDKPKKEPKKKVKTKKQKKIINKTINDMNITQEAKLINESSKTIETIEMHKHSKNFNSIEGEELIGKLYVRAEYRNMFLDKNLNLFYKENGNIYFIAFKYTINVKQKELDFLFKIYPFATLSQNYIKTFFDNNYNSDTHFSILNKWIHTAAMDRSKVYVTTKAKQIVRNSLMKPHFITNEKYQELTYDEKKEYIIKAITFSSLCNEQNSRYNNTYKHLSF